MTKPDDRLAELFSLISRASQRTQAGLGDTLTDVIQAFNHGPGDGSLPPYDWELRLALQLFLGDISAQEVCRLPA